MHSNLALNAGPTHDTTAAPGATSQDTAPTAPTTLRQRLRAARTAMSATQRQHASARIHSHLSHPGPRQWPVLTHQRLAPPQIIAAFWPLPEEPDLRPVLLQWIDQGFDIALPEVVRPSSPLLFRLWSPAAPMQADHFGIPVPTGAPCVPDALLVPTLGFTPGAERLGYGGGYYDRTLAALQENRHPFLAIGVAFACGALAAQEHHAAPHDMPLHAVVTEHGWLLPR